MCEGSHVEGSPFIAVVSPGALDPASCVFQGKGLTAAAAGVPTVVTAVMKDVYGNQRAVAADAAAVTVAVSSASGGAGAAPTFTSTWNAAAGVVDVTYTAAKAGTYSLSFRVNGAEVTTATLTVAPGAAAAATTSVDAAYLKTAGGSALKDG